MSQSAKSIRETDYTCISLDRYITLRKKDINGDEEDKYAEYDITKTEAEIQNRIGLVQIQQDLSPLAQHVKICNDSPSFARQLKNKLFLTMGKVVLIGFFMFMAFYTFVEVVGYAEALMVFK